MGVGLPVGGGGGDPPGSALHPAPASPPPPLPHALRTLHPSPPPLSPPLSSPLAATQAPSTSALRLLPQSAGVMSVYLFMKRYTAEDLYRPHPGFYRPRLSNCSDYSGQFLHPDAWARGRSPSDLSSDASLQMNSSYPALLKCPDYDQMSTSPC